jgi:hypothetical protein
MLLPLLSTSFYLLSSYVLSLYKQEFKILYETSKSYRSIIRVFSIIHNFLLMTFSGYVFYEMCTEIDREYHTYDPSVILPKITFNNDRLLFLSWIFTYSKIYEFFDTYLILWKGQTPILLQKYHHFGAVWVWYLMTINHSVSSLVSTSFNSCVHTVMYFYYFCCSLGYSNKKIKPFITSLQLIQLISGNCILLYYILIPNMDHIHDPRILCKVFLFIYVLILIMMFLKFFMYSYLVKKVKSS